MKVLKSGLVFLFSSLLILCVFESYRLNVAADKTERLRAKFLSGNELKLSEIPTKKIDILLKVEDPNFFNHDGIDISTPGAGLTTITQALSKFMYFDNFTPGFAKIEQSLIAHFVLDKRFSKKEQLEVLFNYAYLGQFKGKKVLGFSNASQAYFKKPFSEISYNQYLSLVAMLIAPNNMHVINKPKENQERVFRISKLIKEQYKPSGVMDVYYGEVGA